MTRDGLPRPRRRCAAMADYDDVWIVIPVYNEGAVIGDVVERTRETFPNIVCVDDGSRDDSAERIAHTGAHLVRHPVNLGQGAALQTGITYALAQPGMRYLVTFDADGQHGGEAAEAMIAGAAPGAPTWCWVRGSWR